MLENRIIKHLAFLDCFSKDSLYSFETFNKPTEILKYKKWATVCVVCSPPKPFSHEKEARPHTEQSDMEITQGPNRMN